MDLNLCILRLTFPLCVTHNNLAGVGEHLLVFSTDNAAFAFYLPSPWSLWKEVLPPCTLLPMLGRKGVTGTGWRSWCRLWSRSWFLFIRKNLGQLFVFVHKGSRWEDASSFHTASPSLLPYNHHQNLALVAWKNIQWLMSIFIPFFFFYFLLSFYLPHYLLIIVRKYQLRGIRISIVEQSPSIWGCFYTKLCAYYSVGLLGSTHLLDLSKDFVVRLVCVCAFGGGGGPLIVCLSESWDCKSLRLLNQPSVLKSLVFTFMSS